jgi:ketosteroid isomerase-like protein
MENDSVKGDTAGDPSYVEKNYADNFSGGSSWGNWETKQSILADMKDNKNNKTNSEVISDLNVRIYGDTAIATYKSTYDSLYHGEQRARTILSTDTFVRQDGSWKQVASHSSELAK